MGKVICTGSLQNTQFVVSKLVFVCCVTFY